jgi:hypothetical protein
VRAPAPLKHVVAPMGYQGNGGMKRRHVTIILYYLLFRELTKILMVVNDRRQAIDFPSCS